MASLGPTVAPSMADVSWSEWLDAAGQTCGLIVQIDAEAFRYHSLELNPLWGARRVSSGLFDEWGAALAASCAGLAQRDATERLLRNGLLVEGSRRIELKTLRPVLARLLDDATAGQPAAVRLVGPNRPGLNQLVIDILGFPPSDSGLTHFPTVEELDQVLAGYCPRLPWSLGLLAAERRGRQLESVIVELLPAGHLPVGAAGSRVYQSATHLVHLEPGAIVARLLFVRDNDEVIAAYEVSGQPDEPLRLWCAITEPDAQPTLMAEGATLRSLRRPRKPPVLPRIVTVGQPLDVAFLLDGTLPADDFAAVVGCLRHITAALADETHSDIRLGCVVYGEYDHVRADGRRVRSPLEVKSLPFQPPKLFDRSLSALRAPPQPTHDFCDALELGLRAMSQEMEWAAEGLRRDALRRVVLIGHSPPHPTYDELTDYNLLTRSTAEFRRINWNTELKRLLALPNTRFASVWVAPHRRSSHDRYVRFARHVWQTIGRDYLQDGLSTVEESEMLLAALRDHRQAAEYLEAPLPIPLISRLAEVRSAAAFLSHQEARL